MHGELDKDLLPSSKRIRRCLPAPARHAAFEVHADLGRGRALSLGDGVAASSPDV
jgi:hypothetical protein